MSRRIYFDNAATTPIDPLVFEAMKPFFTDHFGNPSSIYSYGRESRLAIENARKKVASLLGAHPAEIFFTSGGTESSNTAIHGAVHQLGCKRIISSKIEHHATLHTCEYFHKHAGIELEWVHLLPDGHIDLADLEKRLSSSPQKTLVTLMHANNELGNITDIKAVGELCKKYSAVYHADTVQTVGHYPINLSQLEVDFITASSHKFHGPKGVGILYMRSNAKIDPYIHGGGQERNMRAGTENIYGIVGFTKALELALENLTSEKKHIEGVKNYLKEKLSKQYADIVFNGDAQNNSLYTVLSVGFPLNDKTEMLLFNLDVNHICVSGGSACSSGANQGSHVIQALNLPPQSTVRFSFSKYNTKEEVDRLMDVLGSVV